LFRFHTSHPAPPPPPPLSLHDALPIWLRGSRQVTRILPEKEAAPLSARLRPAPFPLIPASPPQRPLRRRRRDRRGGEVPSAGARSEEHTSELQSRENLVCRLLLEKKKS